MALAGHAVVVQVADTDIAGDVLDGIKSVDWGPSGNLLDTTDFADTSAAHTRILGLKDNNITISGDYESADAGQSRIRTNWASGASIFFRFLPNGTTGFKVETKVQEFKINAGFDGTVEFSATLMGTGAIGTV